LEIIRDTFRDPIGDAKGGDPDKPLSLKVLDRSANFSRPVVLTGWDNINFLRKEGNHELITQRLTTALERARSAGRIDDDCHRQAAGQHPRERGRSLDR
jgi:hypothetical protein